MMRSIQVYSSVVISLNEYAEHTMSNKSYEKNTEEHTMFSLIVYIIKWMRGGGRKEMNRRVSWRERGKGQSIHKVLYDDLIDCSTGMTITMERGVKGSVALLDIYKGVCVLRWIYRVLDSVYYNGKGSKRGFAWHL